jgi:hypothetical protein
VATKRNFPELLVYQITTYYSRANKLNKILTIY